MTEYIPDVIHLLYIYSVTSGVVTMIALIIKGFQVLLFVFRALLILFLMNQMNIKCYAH